MSSILLLAALIPLILHAPLAAAAEPAPVSVAFPKFGTPPGWTRYDSAGLTPGVEFGFGNASVPFAFRSFIRRTDGFTYTHIVPPARYNIRLGLIELTADACTPATRKRRFTIQVNNRVSATVDIVAAAGCRTPYVLPLNNVRALTGNLKITTRQSDGSHYPPVLSNFVAVAIADSVPVSPTPQPVGPPISDSPPVLALDVGSPDDDGGVSTYFIGATPPKCVPTIFPIANTVEDARISTYCWGKTLTYHLPVGRRTRYDVRLSFAETYVAGCKNWFRTFSAAAYDPDNRVATTVSVSPINVFKEVGCKTVHTVTLRNVRVGRKGKLAVSIVAIKNNAMLSAIDVYKTVGGSGPSVAPRPDISPSPSPQPATPPVDPTHPTRTTFKINVGKKSDRAPKSVNGTSRISIRGWISGTPHANAGFYNTARVGHEFEYSVPLKPGAYYIILGFAEINRTICNKPGARVFNVFVNGQLQLEGFDIIARRGCRKALEVRVRQSVSALDIQPMVVRFESVMGGALLSFLYIRPADMVCNQGPNPGQLTADHGAHAEAGSYPPYDDSSSEKSYVDTDGDGYVMVTIDGSSSHTHLLKSSNNCTGIIQYTWTFVETGKLLSQRARFRARFPLGVTRLKLAVVDCSCTTDEEETTVTVTGSIQSGAYCYYYDGLTEIPRGGILEDEPHPQFAATMSSMLFPFPDFPFSKELFAMRCTFLLRTEIKNDGAVLRLSPFATGHALLFKGGDQILDTEQDSEVTTALPVGLTAFEIIYLRTIRGAPPRLKFLVDGVPPLELKDIFHDRKTVVPIITTLSPPGGQLSGDTTVKVTGYGLFQPLIVKFGKKKAKVLSSGASKFQFLVKSPPAELVQEVDLSVSSQSDRLSNVLKFSYGSGCDSVAFDRKELKREDGTSVDNLELPTTVEIGQDGKLYIGTMAATVHVVGYSRETLKVISQCQSKPLIDESYTKDGTPSPRTILGIAFHPGDAQIRPYVTSSTLYAFSKNLVDPSNMNAWKNGAVDRLKPGTDPTDSKICLIHDIDIVRNLPVSNHDHSNNALLFTQAGDLLIAQGGNTNLGLPGAKFGGWWETDMSAAILIARLSKPGFNGVVTYYNSNVQYLARKNGGDVDVYASGIRNPFAMTMTHDGEVYTVDQGSNCNFGDIASGCNDFDEVKARTWNVSGDGNWPGAVKPKAGGCGFSAKRPDKVLHIREGAFYGHANLARGRGQCRWIDPYSDKTANGDAPPPNYQAPMKSVKSSVTGLRQYHGNHFCGALRNELLLSSYKGSVMYRMRVEGGTVKSGPDQMANFGGLTFTENAHGELLMPSIEKKKLYMIRPRIRDKTDLTITGLVPSRHGLAGGTLLSVGGFGFNQRVSVEVGGEPCPLKMRTWSEVRCTVPAMRSGGLRDITVYDGFVTVTLPNAVLYMNV